MSGNVSHARAGDSPPSSGYAQPSPYAALLAKIEEVEAYTHTVLQQYPKIERYALCADIRVALANIQRLSIVAWKRYHKKTTLQDLDVEIDVLISRDCGTVDAQKSEEHQLITVLALQKYKHKRLTCLLK